MNIQKQFISYTLGGVVLIPLPIQSIPLTPLSLSPHISTLIKFNRTHSVSQTKEIYQIAEQITVQIWSDNFLGSGIIIEKEKHDYIVLTSYHLIRWAEPPYRVKTPDGEFYNVQVLDGMNLGELDLRLLKFQAPQKNYTVAKLGSSHKIQPKETVYATGFPLELPQSIQDVDMTNSSPPQGDIIPLKNQPLIVTKGQVFTRLNQSLEKGYQLGYTNEIQKGMSGGAVLNQQGEVIAVNGIHANPVWVFDAYYENGVL